MAGGFEHANERGRIAGVEVTVPANRIIAHLVDVVSGVEQLDAIVARRYRRLDGELSVQAPPDQLGLESVVALRAERMSRNSCAFITA